MNQVDVPQKPRAAAAKMAASTGRGLFSQVSIIVPIGPNDASWRSLIADLAEVSTEAELWLVAAESQPTDLDQLRTKSGICCKVRWIATATGRAHQMNRGAELSTRPFLWFLHADSRLSVDALVSLERSLDALPSAIHFFDLAFQDDGPALTRMNALGVRIRSRFLALPFGDQGLCMSRDMFQRLGGFDETTAYGEDHLLVWAAHHHRVPLHCVGAFIETSARKYRTNGWLSTTLMHAWRTWRQAIPQFVRLLWERCG